MAFEMNIVAFKHAPFGGVVGDEDIVIAGVDWSGADFLWAIGSPDDLAIDIQLESAAAGVEGVSTAYEDNWVDPITGEAGPATLIRPQINETTLENLNFVEQNDLVLTHTLYVTPPGNPRRVLAYGTLTVRQMVSDS